MKLLYALLFCIAMVACNSSKKITEKAQLHSDSSGSSATTNDFEATADTASESDFVATEETEITFDAADTGNHRTPITIIKRDGTTIIDIGTRKATGIKHRNATQQKDSSGRSVALKGKQTTETNAQVKKKETTTLTNTTKQKVPWVMIVGVVAIVGVGIYFLPLRKKLE